MKLNLYNCLSELEERAYNYLFYIIVKIYGSFGHSKTELEYLKSVSLFSHL